MKKANKQSDLDKYGFYEENNSYWFREITKSGNEKVFTASNFTIKILFSLSNGNSGKYIMQLTNRNNEVSIFQITNDDFVNISKFRTIIEPKYLYSGNLKMLYQIKQKIFEGIDTAKEIITLGYQVEPGFFAFSNGIVVSDGKFLPTDKYGIVSYNNMTYYMPAYSEINQRSEDYINERKFIFKPGTLSFEEYTKLIYQAYGFNGVVSMLYDIAAIFRDIIFSHTGFFPHLFKFGIRGTAKSSQTNFSLALFGDPQIAINLEGASTEKGMSRKIAQLRNALIVFEEYTNKISDKAIGILKTIYDGIGYEKGQYTNDNKTYTTPVLSGSIIIGNELPTIKSALFDRIILLQYEKGTEHNKFTAAEEEAYRILERETKAGLGNILSEVFRHRQQVKQAFYERYNELRDIIKYSLLKDEEGNIYKIGTRAINNLAAVLAPYTILAKLIKFPFDDKWFTTELINNLVHQNEILNKVTETNVFWDAMQFATSECKISEDKHYRLLNKDDGKVIYIRYDLLYPVYKEYCVRNANKPLDKESLIANLKSSKAFIPSDLKNRDTAIIRFKREGNKTKSVYGFRYEALGIDLYMIQSQIQIPEIDQQN